MFVELKGVEGNVEGMVVGRLKEVWGKWGNISVEIEDLNMSMFGNLEFFILFFVLYIYWIKLGFKLFLFYFLRGLEV